MGVKLLYYPNNNLSGLYMKTLANDVTSIQSFKYKSEFLKILEIASAADWFTKTNYIASLLKLPVDQHLMDPELTILDNTVAAKLGHENIKDFISKPNAEMGLSIPWGEWKDLVTASRYRNEFGINTTDMQDILNQVDDVKVVIGRFPISRNEFNHGKSIIQKAAQEKVEEEHAEQVNEMSANISSLMQQLELEKNAKHKAILELESAYEKIQDLQTNSQLKDNEHNVIMSDYIKRSLYEQIIDRMEDLEAEHEKLTQEYIDKIIKLEQNEVVFKNQLETLKSKYTRAVSRLRTANQIDDKMHIVKANKEVTELKKKMVGVMKNLITEKQKNQRLHIITDKQKYLLSAYKQKMENDGKVVNEKTFNSKWAALLITTVVAAGSIMTGLSMSGMI